MDTHAGRTNAAVFFLVWAENEAQKYEEHVLLLTAA